MKKEDMIETVQTAQKNMISNAEQNKKYKESLGECSAVSCSRPAAFRSHHVFVFCSNRCERKHLKSAAKNRVSDTLRLCYTVPGDQCKALGKDELAKAFRETKGKRKRFGGN